MQDIRYITVVNNFDTLGRALFESNGINSQNIIIIDNTLVNNPISYNYNCTIRDLLKERKSEWLAFCHQDFYIGEDILLKLYNMNKDFIYGPIGATHRGLLGKITQTNGLYIGADCEDCIVDVLDAMCMIIHKDTIKKYNLLFDEKFRYHFYVEDFCLQAKTKGILTKIIQMNCQHRSKDLIGDINSSEYKESRRILINKWKNVRTTTGLHRLDIELYDIEHLVDILEEIRLNELMN